MDSSLISRQSPPRKVCRRSSTTRPLVISELSPMKEWLHEDIIHEILSRLPAKSLARFNCVCKNWQRIISSSFFFKTQIQNRKLKSTATGFIFQNDYSTSRTCYIPIENGNNLQASKSILLTLLPRDSTIMSSSNGLLCYRNRSPESKLEICVSNLVNNHFIKLCQIYPKLYSEVSIELACVKNFAEFKLVRVVKTTSFSLHLKFEIYSSETREWRFSTAYYIENPKLTLNKRGVCIRNMLYWITCDEYMPYCDGSILVFDVEKEIAQFIRSPTLLYYELICPVIAEFEGSLHYVEATIGIRVWRLESDLNWTLKYSTSISDLFGEYIRCFSRSVTNCCGAIVFPLGFKDLVLMMKLCNDLIAYDIKNKKMTPVSLTADFEWNSVFPFHMLA